MKYWRIGFVAACLLGLTFGLSVGQTVSPVRLDANLEAGYQGARLVETVSPGEVVSLEIFGQDLDGASGFSATVVFDPEKVVFDGFQTGEVIPGLTGLKIEETAGKVEIGGASVEGTAAHSEGRLGVIRFRIGSGFSGTATVSITQATLSRPDGQTDLEVSSTVVLGQAEGSSVVLDADLSVGHQGADAVEGIAVGQHIPIEVYGTGLDGALGFSADLTFDADQVSFVGFTAGNLIPGFTGLKITGTSGTVEIGGASVEGTAGQASGRLGVVVFEVATGFSGQTEISVSASSLARAEGQVNLDISSAVTVIGEGGDGGIEPPSGESGPIALDLNLEVGDQGQRQTTSTPQAGNQVVIDVVAVSGALGNIGFQVVLAYDPAQLQFDGFQPKDLWAAGVPIVPPASGGEAQVQVALLGQTASPDAGSMGHATFTVLDGFTGAARVEIKSASYDNPVEVGSGGAFVVIGGPGGIPTDPVAASDFSGDGTVDFADFLTFAQNFGKSSGDADFNARIDLDQDGTVGFSDFIQFAQSFGKQVGG